MKQESQFVTYAAGSVKGTVDCIVVRQEDRAKIHNIKVSSNEECIPKHNLLVMHMQFDTTKRWCKKFEPRVREEYKRMVTDKIEEAQWKYFDVSEH